MRLEEGTKKQIDDDIIYDGVIQRFEFTFELSSKLMKVFLQYTGINELKSPRSTIKEAYTYGLIENGDQWIDMMIDRNKTSHLYDEEEAKLIYQKVKHTYTPLFTHFLKTLETEIKQVEGEL
ncbi:nucleotidyltransferase substrate binding protein [Shouchella shacheensis]|uniref:nucleotidyltransferase substrate binding protein n=1 Tax=Shouchella shacheensis TaxID=1649580 RepID=UPI00073FE3E1|nr:nucleotidyltransferase substrate binding protein [Shouchella shacheensis]